MTNNDMRSEVILFLAVFNSGDACSAFSRAFVQAQWEANHQEDFDKVKRLMPSAKGVMYVRMYVCITCSTIDELVGIPHSSLLTDLLFFPSMSQKMSRPSDVNFLIDTYAGETGKMEYSDDDSEDYTDAEDGLSDMEFDDDEQVEKSSGITSYRGQKDFQAKREGKNEELSVAYVNLPFDVSARRCFASLFRSLKFLQRFYYHYN